MKLEIYDADVHENIDVYDALDKMTDSWLINGNCCPQTAMDFRDATNRLLSENAELKDEVERLQTRAIQAEHVLGEEAGNPEDWYCRCEQCKKVANEIDDAGMCNAATDRWWEE